MRQIKIILVGAVLIFGMSIQISHAQLDRKFTKEEIKSKIDAVVFRTNQMGMPIEGFFSEPSFVRGPIEAALVPITEVVRVTEVAKNAVVEKVTKFIKANQITADNKFVPPSPKTVPALVPALTPTAVPGTTVTETQTAPVQLRRLPRAGASAVSGLGAAIFEGISGTYQYILSWF